MPACVTPRGITHSPKGSLVLLCMIWTFLDISIFILSARESFLVLSAAGQSGNTPETRLPGLVPAGVHGACPVEIWEITTGEHSEILGLSRRMWSHVHVANKCGSFGINTDVRLAPPAVLCPTWSLAARHSTTTASTSSSSNSNATKLRAAPVMPPSVGRVLPLLPF